MPQLDAIKMMYPGDALWTALQFRPPAGPNMTPVEEQQLRAAQMDLLLAEQRARNAVKGFWHGTLRAMQQVIQTNVRHACCQARLFCMQQVTQTNVRHACCQAQITVPVA